MTPQGLPSDVVDFLHGLSQTEGNAERWHCDNGGEFENRYMRELMELLNIKSMTHGKALHPQTQGLVERENGQLVCTRSCLLDTLKPYCWLLLYHCTDTICC